MIRPLPIDDLEHVLLHTGEAWESLRGKAVFITGGTGFFGMWLLESFAYANDALNLGARLVVLTRNTAAFVAKAPHLSGRSDIKFLQGDVRDFVFPEERFDFIIHAATDANLTLTRENPGEMLDVVVAGTRHVLAFAEYCGAKDFLLTSSGAVYGPSSDPWKPFPEDWLGAPDSVNPSSSYAEGKRMAELMSVIHCARFGCRAKIARCFAFVGPHLPLDTSYALGNFVRDARAGGPIRIGGDGTPRRSYLYAADLAVWLWVMLLKAPHGRAYNVGSRYDVSIRELAELIAVEIGGDCPVIIGKAPVPGNGASAYVPSVERAAMDLGLVERIPLPEGLRRMNRWLSQCESCF